MFVLARQPSTVWGLCWCNFEYHSEDSHGSLKKNMVFRPPPPAQAGEAWNSAEGPYRSERGGSWVGDSSLARSSSRPTAKNSAVSCWVNHVRTCLAIDCAACSWAAELSPRALSHFSRNIWYPPSASISVSGRSMSSSNVNSSEGCSSTNQHGSQPGPFKRNMVKQPGTPPPRRSGSRREGWEGKGSGEKNRKNSTWWKGKGSEEEKKEEQQKQRSTHASSARRGRVPEAKGRCLGCRCAAPLEVLDEVRSLCPEGA